MQDGKNGSALTRMAVGAASPTAQGQAMTMTARENMKEKRAGPAKIRPAGAFENRGQLVDFDAVVAVAFSAHSGIVTSA